MNSAQLTNSAINTQLVHIIQFLGRDRMSQQYQAIALAEYTLEIQAQLYIQLYRQVVAKVLLIKKWAIAQHPTTCYPKAS